MQQLNVANKDKVTLGKGQLDVANKDKVTFMGSWMLLPTRIK